MYLEGALYNVTKLMFLTIGCPVPHIPHHYLVQYAQFNIIEGTHKLGLRLLKWLTYVLGSFTI